MHNYTVRKTRYSQLTIKDCRIIFNYSASIRGLVLNWTDVPAVDLLNRRFYGQFLRRLVVRAMKEQESVYMKNIAGSRVHATNGDIVCCEHCDYNSANGVVIYYQPCGHSLCEDCYSAVLNGVDDSHK